MGDGPGASASFETFATGGETLACGMLQWRLAELPVAS